MQGVLIAVEGIGGSGKSTLARGLVGWLEESGVHVIATREPGGTRFGQELRQLLLGSDTVRAPLAEAMLFEADRAQTYQEVIGPAIGSGHVVVSDRNLYGTIAYQAFGAGLDLEVVDHLNRVATAGLYPDLVLVVDCDPTMALARKAGELERDRFDERELSYQTRVREGFRFAASRDPGIAHILDGSAQPEIVLAQAREIVKAGLSRLGFDLTGA